MRCDRSRYGPKVETMKQREINRGHSKTNRNIRHFLRLLTPRVVVLEAYWTSARDAREQDVHWTIFYFSEVEFDLGLLFLRGHFGFHERNNLGESTTEGVGVRMFTLCILGVLALVSTSNT